MDPIGIIQVILTIITAVMIVGFAGILYFLQRIDRALAGEQQRIAASGKATFAQPAQAPARTQKEFDPKAIGSLEEHLRAIGEKYRLASLTLATSDGLLIGSTRSGAQDEAAQYSYLYTQGTLRDETGAELFDIPHRGEKVIGIARPSERLPADLMSALKQDARDALQRWV
ncbi:MULTISPECIES: hypothetical protein [Methanoculleus]|jgi:hypothetical protein|uniref:Uncharacterized protein n=1 Tax=Methanoculleus thermophilus TaxID=2200 RepID=A0A1G8YIB0_9EURY|nr:MULTISPECIES: hypothetical protein [Methanoculleus]NLN08352.1 hypothetical protein [Methanoculleus thermophilus]SDK02443.1 hypothetical protein SAMN04488571_10334 [Methanoculleus thermophilus]HQD26017.1 hypothetical protein [Methanoculleus thermophilus]